MQRQAILAIIVTEFVDIIPNAEFHTDLISRAQVFLEVRVIRPGDSHQEIF